MASLIYFAIVISVVALFGACNALQCFQCGQYNDGVGSITPCLNYSAALAHLHLKDCARSSDKFCIKYVSELSIVRDCVETCTEKEVWGTYTYCCNENGCNSAPSTMLPSTMSSLIVKMMSVVVMVFLIAKARFV